MCRCLQGDAAEALHAPLPAIQVDDLDAAFKAVTAADGRITRPALAFPSGRLFHFLDPNGNELAAYQPS